MDIKKKMDGKGFIALPLLLAILLIAFIVIGPALAITVSSELKLLFQIAASIMIISWVRKLVGKGMISILISGVLIYIFVFVLPQFTIGLYALYVVMSLGILSSLIWMIALSPL